MSSKQGVNCVRYNADSSVLLSGSYDKTVRAWDIRARNAYMPIQVLDDFKDSVTSLVVSDHEIIAGCVIVSAILTVDSETDCAVIISAQMRRWHRADVRPSVRGAVARAH